MTCRALALYAWAFLTWLLLTWTRTLEQLVVGALVALGVAVCLTPLGDVAAPWRLLQPRRLLALLRLGIVSLGRIVRANVDLTRRTWTPSLPIHTGMVVLPTRMRSDGGLAATGLITSLIVDNQIVDVDRDDCELQYHAISVPHGNRKHPEDDINAPLERLLAPILGRTTAMCAGAKSEADQ